MLKRDGSCARHSWLLNHDCCGHGLRYYASSSGVAKLGHTGERALATTGCAPPVQVYNRILGTDSIVVDHKLGTTFILHELAVSDHDLYCTV